LNLTINYWEEVRELASEITKIYEYLSKRGIKMSKEKVEENLIKFLLDREDELIEAIKQGESDEKLKEWLENPVDSGRRSNAVKEHNTVL